MRGEDSWGAAVRIKNRSSKGRVNGLLPLPGRRKKLSGTSSDSAKGYLDKLVKAKECKGLERGEKASRRQLS